MCPWPPWLSVSPACCSPCRRRRALLRPFTLGAGDVLEVSVWGDESLTRPNVIVRPDGKISFPLVGDMQAAGKTVEQLRKEFETRYRGIRL